MAGFADPMVTINQATQCHSPGDHIWSFRNRRQFISSTIIVTILSLSLLILWTRRTGLVVFTSTDRQQQPTTVPAWSGRYRWRPILRTRQPSRQSVSYVRFCDSHKSFLIPWEERRSKGKSYPTHHLYSWHFGVSVSRMMSAITLTWRFICSCCQKRCFPMPSFRVAYMM
jgi:hypothetical protein